MMAFHEFKFNHLEYGKNALKNYIEYPTVGQR